LNKVRAPNEFDLLYLAVLPFYRQSCVAHLASTPGLDVRFYAGSRHIDSSIRTGIDPDLYTQVVNHVVASRILIQRGGWRSALAARTTVLDLNPRSVSAWCLLLARRSLRRRTLVWGHLHPRAGGSSKTAILRRIMRRISSGTILYGFDSVPSARAELPGAPVWVAPNSLYSKHELGVAVGDGPYRNVLYVGRLVASKKVDVLIRGFLLSDLRDRGVRLVIVGDGQERSRLTSLVSTLGGDGSVDFTGHIADVATLRGLYENALCSVSPGYVGLSLTQSLGFGVPMIVSRDEPHAPEIELARLGGVSYFDTDLPGSLARALEELEPSEQATERRSRIARISETYSAESMAAGLLAALSNLPQELEEDGWPAPRR
jgi:glycosyltransferase involved in cell wall biosynthesis